MGLKIITEMDAADEARDGWIEVLCNLDEDELIQQVEEALEEIAASCEQGDAKAHAKVRAALAAFNAEE